MKTDLTRAGNATGCLRTVRAYGTAALALIRESFADREIARRLGISPTTVGALRRTLP